MSLRKWWFVSLLVLAASPRVLAQDVAGDWTGALDVGGTQLHLVMHITKSAGGALAATLDSVDQNALGIPVKSVKVESGKLTLDIPAIRGSYAGTVSDDAKTINGTWTQGTSLPLNFTRSPAKVETKPVAPSDIDGAWSGDLDTGGPKLRLVFHVMNTANGLKGSLDSVDQGANGIPVATVTRNGSSIKFDIPVIGGTYEAKISEDLSRMEGTWSQGGHSLPLTLNRLKKASELEHRRPQEPKTPLPYTSREVRYENKNAGVTLAGTLTIPRGDGPFPAVLLICGSGPHDRDETVMGHKPFLVLSDYLTRHGIAVLRSDKRGIGQSGGVYATATMADFASDAAAGIAFLKSVPEVNGKRIGLVGHSEGAVVAPMVAANHNEVAFVVLLAGSGVPGDQIVVEQTRLIAAAGGASAEQANQIAAKERAILDAVKSGADAAKLRSMLKGTMPDAAIDSSIAQLTSPWYRNFIAWDPATALKSVKCPLLAVAGSKDLQVPPQQNLPAMRQALEGNKNVEIAEFPNLNHLFQHAKSGSPSEYAQIEETMAPEVMEKVAGWIAQR